MGLTPQQIEFVEKYLGVALSSLDLTADAPRSKDATSALVAAVRDTTMSLEGLRSNITGLGHDDLNRIANSALRDVLKTETSALVRAVAAWNKAAPEDQPGLAAGVLSELGAFRQSLSQSAVVKLCEDNPFGVRIAITEPMTQALDKIENVVSG